MSASTTFDELALTPAEPPLSQTPAADAPVSGLKMAGMALGVLVILAGNFLMRSELERTPLPYYAVFPNNNEVPLSWKLLLPVEMGDAVTTAEYQGSYHWITTSVTVQKYCEQFVAPNTVFYAFNAAHILCTFLFSWWMFRSAVFSFTITLCMAFGTQLHWLYICSSIVAFYLCMIYLQANVLCLLKVLQTDHRGWRFGYAATLVVLALSHEQWLDYLSFLFLGSAFVLLYARQAQLPDLKRRAWFVLIVAGLVVVTYLAVRLSYGRQQYRPGHESEMIFTYRLPIMAIEDFISNVLTYIYMAISNFFPPFMVSSNSLYYHGADRIVAEQHGYHQAQSNLVVMHHLFFWYFWAGIVFAIFVYFFFRNAKIALQEKSSRHVHLTLVMLMIACGFAIHSLVKYRPYLSVPLLTYKCLTSTVGVSFLLAYCMMYSREFFARWKALAPVCVVLVWGVIVYGGLTRPAYLSHLSKQVGLSELPDPRANLRRPNFLRADRNEIPTEPASDRK